MTGIDTSVNICVLISSNQTNKAMSIHSLLIFEKQKKLRHFWMYCGTNGQSVSVSCQLNEVFKHFEWNFPLKKFDTAGLVLWYSLSHLKLSHSTSLQTIWKYIYMFCMIWNNILWTHFFFPKIYLLYCLLIGVHSNFI